MTPIEYHAEHCQTAKPAVDVKDRTLYARSEPYATLIEQIGKDVAQALYECAREGFWMDAEVLADQFGYGEAFSEGRSSGWLVVSAPPDFDLLADDGTIIAEADDDERERTRADVAAWLKFTESIESAVEDARTYYVELMREHLAACAFEASGSAEMAARDIVTV